MNGDGKIDLLIHTYARTYIFLMLKHRPKGEKCLSLMITEKHLVFLLLVKLLS